MQSRLWFSVDGHSENESGRKGRLLGLFQGAHLHTRQDAHDARHQRAFFRHRLAAHVSHLVQPRRVGHGDGGVGEGAGRTLPGPAAKLLSEIEIAVKSKIAIMLFSLFSD